MSKSLKRSIVIATPLAIFLLVTLLWVEVAKPLLLDFIKQQIPHFNTSQNFVLISTEDIDISLIRLQLSAKNIKVDFMDKSLNLKPIRIESATAQLDIFNLIIGQINIAKLGIDHAQFEFDLKESSDSSAQLPKIPIEEIFSNTKLVPIDRIILNECEFKLNDSSQKPLANITAHKATLANLKSELILLLDKISFSSEDEAKKNVEGELNLNATLSHESLNIKVLTLKLLDSVINLDAKFSNYGDLLNNPRGELNLNSQINLEDVRNVLLTFFPQKNRIPSISGKISTSGKLGFNSLNDINGQVSMNTSQVVLDHFKLGQAELALGIRKNQLMINEIKLEHTAGKATLKNTKIEQRSPYHFSTKIEFDGLDLYKFFQSIGLSDVPAGLQADGSAQCEGLLGPAPLVNCTISTDMKDIFVKSDIHDSSSIIKLKRAHITGETKFTKDKLNYRADIQLGQKSTGSSTGEVKFEEGFNIQFETNNLDFADVESLANLNLKGVTKIIGSTSGDSHKGIINATLSASNAEIEKFRVGNFRSNLSYKEGQLAFSNLNAVVGKSNLSGNLVFDFEKSTLESEINSTDLHGEDLFFILKKRFEIPFDLTGTGQAHAKIHGPINFWKLNYNLTSELNQGSLAGERFEKLTANLDSDGEKINFTNVKLKKQKSNLTVEGRIATNGPEPQFDLKVKTNPLQLEESDYVIQYAPSIAGIGYTDGTVTGPIDSPTFISNVTLKQLTYDKVEYPNSQGQLKIDKKYLYFNGQFFGRQIQTDLLWPWNEQDNFSAKILIQELNPLFLLPLVSIPQPSSDFYSRLNAEVDLTSKHRSFSSADGLIKVSDFVLQRGNQSLHLTKPSRMIFKNGLSQMEDFNLTGEDSYLKVQMDKTMLSRVRFNIESDLQLRLLHFLVPFMQTLSGKLVLNSQVVFKDSGFELLGDGEITDGLVGLKGFPQTIENINAPIEFSKSKIILSDITGQMGPSDVTGLGTIDIIDSHNIEVSLKAVADNVQLNFPDKFFTQGKADVLFSGNWLPYNLKINYKVTQGLIENDFEPDPKQSLSLKASSFLPPQQVQALSPSLALDINVDLANGVLIKNKLLEGEAKGNIQVQGSPEQPIILGKINITPGSKIMFKDKPFDVQFGDVKFLGTKEINPELNIGANSHVSDYDITIQVQGLAKDFKITASSQPPLSQSDIITLLALGVTNQANQTLSSDTQQKQTGLEVLAAITNQSQLNKKIQDRLGLTLQLAPAVDSTKNIAVPKVVVTKKISKKVNASYSKPFTGNDQNQEVKLQYLYNNNVSFQVNYQNKEGTQTDQITNTTTTNKSIFGVDLEYRDEFK